MYRNTSTYPDPAAVYRWVLLMALGEWLVILCSGAGFSGLTGLPLFLGFTDPAYLLIDLTGWPRALSGSMVLSAALDLSVTGVLILGLRGSRPSRSASLLFVLFLLHYLTYTGYIGHRNFQTGLIWVWIPFLWPHEHSRVLALSALRYFILLFYFSAGVFKLYHWITNGGEIRFETILPGQYGSYIVEGHLSPGVSLSLWLSQHESVAALIWLLGMSVELFSGFGFFSTRTDRYIWPLIILLHLGSWILLDIAPWGQISLLVFMMLICNKKGS